MLAVFLHCVYINIHHKVLFSQFPFLQQIIKRVAKCMNALNVYILDKAATLHPYMHDIRGGGGWSGTLFCNESTS